MRQLIFDTNGNEKQKQVARFWLDQETSSIAYGGSKGSGKSFLLVSLIFGDAFIYPNTMYFIARKQLNDLRKFTIPSIYEVFNIWGIDKKMYKYNGQDNFFELSNGSKVFLLEAKYMPSDPFFYRFGSMQMTRGAIEEAGEFDYKATSNLSASIGRWKNEEYGLAPKLLQTCNPAKGYLYNDYYKPNKEGIMPPYRKFVQALPTDNKKLAKGYIEHLENILTATEKKRLLYGDWEYDDDPAILIEYNKILDIYTNDFVEEGGMYITADIARLGKDKTVILVWSGWRVIKIVVIPKSTLDYVQDKIRDLQKLYKVPNSNTIVDEDGVGGGVKDNLKCRGFVANNSPLEEGKIRPNYQNLKTQCTYILSKKVNNNELYVICPEICIQNQITQELELIKGKNIDKEGKIQIIGKDEIKKMLGRSPDYSDALVFRAWFDITNNFKILTDEEIKNMFKKK